MDSQLIETIYQLALHQAIYKKKKDSQRIQRTRNSITANLYNLRKISTLYLEFSALDNLEVLGEEFIRQMKRDLPPLIFNTSIMNMKPRKVEDGFYCSLSEKIHFYDAYDNSVLDQYDYNFTKISSIGCLQDADLDRFAPLAIALDYNAAINSLVVGQTQGESLKFLNSFFVKSPQKLKDVVQDFCDYYRGFSTRDIIYYYDATAIAVHPILDYSFKDEVIRVLTKNRFRVTEKYIGKPVAHKQKNFMWDVALKGDKYLFPLFNRNNCEYLLISMQQAGIKYGRNGYEKDKSLEHNPQYPQEQTTHISDAADTLFIGSNLYPVSAIGSVPSTNFGN